MPFAVTNFGGKLKGQANRPVAYLEAARLVTDMKSQTVTKLEAAKRQLDTAIKLYFDNEDSLSIHTLAYASFKILFDLYPSIHNDGFSAKIDELIQQPQLGWSRFNRTANFLKHADRDPLEKLEHHDAEYVEGTIGLASCLYRRIAGDFTSRMRAFDCWTEALHPEAFDIPPDPDPYIANQEDEAVRKIRALPISERLAMGKLMSETLTKLWEMKEAGQIDGTESNAEIARKLKR